MPNNDSDSHQLNLSKIARQTMLDEGFEPDIPASVADELRAIEGQKTPQPSPQTRDLRSLLWSSIDNLESRDLDQVEFAEPLANDNIRVLIGIADVDSEVAKGSAIDLYAYKNTTSVYTGVTTFSMLPEELSTDRTSMVQGEDRLAIVIEYVVAPDGTTSEENVYPATVHNYAKMSYDVIGKWLDNGGPAPVEVTRVANLADQVRLQAEAANRLLEARRKNGALELDTIQTTAVVDEDGRVTDLAVSERNGGRDIIENFMIAANVTMSEYLAKHNVTSLRRVVETPRNWPRIVEIAKEVNERLPTKADAHALADFLERRRVADPDHFVDLSLAVVKLLGPGEYVVEKPYEAGRGHFGLAVHNYTHSTAPNRRYADLITQRLLKASSLKTADIYSVDQLKEIAQHCNERESAARTVERKMRKVAAAMLMRNRIGEEFDAIVTGVTPKGTFARTLKPPVDGLVVQGKEGLKVGQQVRAKLLSTDPEKGFIDFGVARSRR